METDKKPLFIIMAIKFLAGAVMGFAAGIAVGRYLSSERGKKFKSKLGEIMEDFKHHIAPKLNDLRVMTVEEYNIFMDAAVEQYGKMKNMSKEMIRALQYKVRKSKDAITGTPG
jgi:hypothetical protein